jgi:putative endonuclease
MPCVYVLQSEQNGHLYIGSSRENDPQARIISHNSGKSRSTKSGRLWKLIYQEFCDDYTAARKRELFLKSGYGRKWIKDSVVRDGAVLPTGGGSASGGKTVRGRPL